MISTTTVKKKYDGMGNRLSQTINNERTTAYTYTARNQLESVTNALGEVNRYTYDDNGRLATQTNQLGDTVAYQYDKDSRVTRVRDQENREVSYTYDKNGNVTHVSTGNQLTSRYTYDALNRLTQATTGDDKPITAIYTYDSVGNVTSITDGNNHTTTYTYDQLNNVTSRTTPLGDVTSYGYDVNNRLKTMTQPNGTVLTYDYDKLDRLVSKTPQDKPEHQVLYGYDKDGQRISMTDTTGESKYTYNIDGQLTAVTNGDNQTVKYEYDTFGNLSKLVYPDETAVQYTYDALDRLVKVVDRAGKETIYTYDKAGNVVETKRGNGSKAKMTYNRSSQLTKLVNLDSQGAVVSEYTYTYNSAGMIERESITVNGVTMHQQFTYDGSGQLMKTTATQADDQVLFTESYAYDGAGNRTKLVREATDSTTETTFTYDDNNRLTERKVGDKVTTYNYDVNGNRVKQVSDDEELTYGYDVYNRLMAVRDKQGLLMAALYDGDDNRVFMVSRTTSSFGYQLFVIPEDKKRKSPYTSVGGFSLSTFWHAITQMFVQSVSVSSSATAKEWTDTFEDLSIAYHKQQAKEKAQREGLVVEHGDTDVKPGDEDVTYASDVNETLIPYTTVEDSMHVYDVKHYVNDVNRKHAQVLSEYDGHKQQHYSYDYGHQRLNQHNHREGKTRTYTTDGRGSVESLSDSDDEKSDRRYSTFGLPTKHNAIKQPFGYNSEAHDVTGLQYLRARYYDPSAGVFLTQDTYSGTLHTPLTQNRYTYVGNNPINYIDPSGHYINLGTGVGLSPIFNSTPDPVNIGSNALKIRPKNWLVDGAMGSGDTGYALGMIPNQYNPSPTPVDLPELPPMPTQGPESTNNDGPRPKTQAEIEAEKQKAYNDKIAELRKRFKYIRDSGLPESSDIYRNATIELNETLKHFCETSEHTQEQFESMLVLLEEYEALQASNSQRQVLYDDLLAAQRGDTQAINRIMQRYDYQEALRHREYRSPDDIARSNQQSWDESVAVIKVFIGEVSGYNDAYRLITGTDPTTGEEVNRFEAGVWVSVDVLGKIATIRKLAKGTKTVDTVSDISKTASTLDKVDDVGDIAKNINPLESVTYSEKVRQQIKIQDFHSFPKSVEAFGEYGITKKVRGGDGILRTHIHISGSYMGREGIFEFIIEADNSLSHRFFREILK